MGEEVKGDKGGGREGKRVEENRETDGGREWKRKDGREKIKRVRQNWEWC